MTSRYRMMSWFWTAALLLVGSPALACPYCVGRDQDGIASSLIIVAMVSVPFLIVAITGVLIRRANKRVGLELPEMAHPDNSEVC